MTGSTTLVNRAGMSDNQVHFQAHRGEESTGTMMEAREHQMLAELVRRGREGDEEALEALYERFKTPLFNLACRYTGEIAAAEDVLQEVFLKAFSHLSDVEDATRFQGWIFRIAVNTSLGHVRSRKAERQRAISLEDIDNLPASSDHASGSALRRPLEEAIQNLPDRLKSVFLLHDVEGFKHEEIANILGCTVGTSKSHLFKARLKLRHLLLKSKVV